MKTTFPMFSVYFNGRQFYGYLVPANDNKIVVGFADEVGCGNVRYTFARVADDTCVRPVSLTSRCGGHDPDLWPLAARIARDSTFCKNADGSYSFATVSHDVAIRLVEGILPGGSLPA